MADFTTETIGVFHKNERREKQTCQWEETVFNGKYADIYRRNESGRAKPYLLAESVADRELTAKFILATCKKLPELKPKKKRQKQPNRELRGMEAWIKK